MTYDPNIPLPTDILSASQADIKDNFTVANNVMAVNHFPFSDTTGKKGNHKYVIFSGIPVPPVPISTDSAVYPKQVAGVTQLFFKNTTQDIQLTGNTSSLTTNGYTTLPNGLIFQWAKINTDGSGNVDNVNWSFTIDAAPCISFPNAVFSIWFQGIKDTNTPHYIYLKDESLLTQTGFITRSDTTWGHGFYFFAIGR